MKLIAFCIVFSSGCYLAMAQVPHLGACPNVTVVPDLDVGKVSRITTISLMHRDINYNITNDGP